MKERVVIGRQDHWGVYATASGLEKRFKDMVIFGRDEKRMDRHLIAALPLRGRRRKGILKREMEKIRDKWLEENRYFY